MCRPLPKGAIDPTELKYAGVPIWCVHGSPVAPRMLCCVIRLKGVQMLPTIYGYSEPTPGHGKFNLFDLHIDIWRNQWQMSFFFADQRKALDFLADHTTPRNVR